MIKNTIRLFFSIILISGCGPAKEAPLPTETPLSVETTGTNESQAGQIYRNDEYKFALIYPADWIIESENYQSVTVVPQEEIAWQPSTPADIPKSPMVRIELGEYIRERIGPAYFPKTVDPITLKAWIEQQVNNNEAYDFSEKPIDGFHAFEITEVGEPGCDKVVYWRPTDLDRLIRISTGCESSYLYEFAQIANSIRQME